MTTPQQSSRRAHLPGRRPRPLEIIFSESDGVCSCAFLYTSQPADTLIRHSRSHWTPVVSRPFCSVRLDTLCCLIPNPPQLALCATCFSALVSKLSTAQYSSFRHEIDRRPQSQPSSVPALSEVLTSVFCSFPKTSATTSIFPFSFHEIPRVCNVVGLPIHILRSRGESGVGIGRELGRCLS